MTGALRTGWPTRGELREMARLAFPIVLVQVGIMAMGVVDTVMLGRVSPEALAAGALGHHYYFTVTIAGLGLLHVLDPIVAQAVGARDERGVALAVQRGLLLSVVVSLLTALLLLPAETVLHALRQPGEVVPLAGEFARWSIPGVLPMFVWTVFRQTLQARERLRPVIASIVAGNLANVLFNWILIFGGIGGLRLGVAGSALSSTLARYVMALVLVGAAWAEVRRTVRPWDARAFAWAPLYRMLALGLPIGAQMLIEVTAFVLVTVFMGWFGTVVLGGHEIALNLASLTFMVPLGVASAAAVLVGQAIGRGDDPAARRHAGAAFVCGVGFMTVTAALFLTLAGELARLYTTVAATAAVAATLIPIAGVFQVFDGLQAVAGGILRGAGDTRATAIAHLSGFYLFALPFSYWLAFRMGRGPEGLWWGLVVGLGLIGVALLGRVVHRLRRPLARVRIEG